jgi:hypothetical protein
MPFISDTFYYLCCYSQDHTQACTYSLDVLLFPHFPFIIQPSWMAHWFSSALCSIKPSCRNALRTEYTNSYSSFKTYLNCHIFVTVISDSFRHLCKILCTHQLFFNTLIICQEKSFWPFCLSWPWISRMKGKDQLCFPWMVVAQWISEGFSKNKWMMNSEGAFLHNCSAYTLYSL